MLKVDLPQIDVPALGMGTWKLSGNDCKDAVMTALDIGYRHIDTAQIYENEAPVGQALRDTSVPRDQIFLTTKVWMDQFHDGDLQQSVEGSLERLQSEYVDLLLLHWPNKDVDLGETLKALTQMQESGKARYIGVSNFTVDLMREAVETHGANIVCNQVEYHPNLSQEPVLDYIRGQNMFLTAYSPLGRGEVLDNPVIQGIAEAHNKTPGQVTLRWLIQQPRVAAIPKSGSRKHLQENFEIFDFELSDDEMRTIHALARPDGRLISPDWAPNWDTGAKKAA